MRFLQPIILTTIVILLMLLAFMGRNLWVGLDRLSTAQNENAQWTIQQLDTEIATLYATLLEERASAVPDAGFVSLRTDIALSRIGIVGRGNAGEILGSVPDTMALLTQLNSYADDMARLVDNADRIGNAELDRMIALTDDIRPIAKQLALLGIAEGAARTEAGRAAFQSKLWSFGMVAIVVVGLLALALIALSWLLTIAYRQKAALSLSSARLRSTVAASLDAVFVVDDGARVIDVNPAAQEIFGYRRAEVIGRDFVTTFLPDAKGAAGLIAKNEDPARNTARVVATGRIDITATRSSGETFPAEMNVAKVRGDGQFINVVYLQDISERRISEDRLVEAKERAERTDQAKSQFLTVMSHEMRTPLNGILGVLDLLRGTPLSARQKEFVDLASGSGDVLLRLINDALDITRIEAGAIALSPVRIDLAAELGRVVEGLEPLAREKGIGVNFAPDPDMPRDVMGDGTRIRQIVTNLVGNAIKFTSEGGIDIGLSCRETDGRPVAEITVRDTGPGISEDHLEVIFDDYVAIAKSAGRQARGDGLGLSISRKIARAMGGNLTVASTKGEGSVFTLTVPLDRPMREAARPPEGMAAGGARVLVVDDNALNRSVLREMLAGMSAHVDEAEDGAVAIRRAEETAYDLIIMDINMPDLDGIEATRRIRAGHGPNRTTHIQGLTAYGEDEFREQVELAGMNGLSGKPIRLAALERLLAGLDPGAAPETSGESLIDAEVFTELCEALGYGAVAERGQRFFEEAEDLLAEMTRLAEDEDGESAARRLHRARGAAVLFGFHRVDAALGAAAESREAGFSTGCRRAVEACERAVAETKTAFQALGLPDASDTAAQ